MTTNMVKGLSLGLTKEELTALESGNMVVLESGATLIVGDDGEVHYCKGRSARPFTRFDTCVPSGNEVFRLAGHEQQACMQVYASRDNINADGTIKDGKDGIVKNAKGIPVLADENGNVKCFRTGGKDESRDNQDSCSIMVLVKLQPKGEYDYHDIMTSKDFDKWEYAYHEVVYLKNGYTLGDVVEVFEKTKPVKFGKR